MCLSLYVYTCVFCWPQCYFPHFLQTDPTELSALMPLCVWEREWASMTSQRWFDRKSDPLRWLLLSVSATPPPHLCSFFFTSCSLLSHCLSCAHHALLSLLVFVSFSFSSLARTFCQNQFRLRRIDFQSRQAALQERKKIFEIDKEKWTWLNGFATVNGK